MPGLNGKFGVHGLSVEFFAKMHEVAKKAELRPAVNGYFDIEEPVTFTTVDGTFWHLRKLKQVEGYDDSRLMRILGAGTRSLDSVEDQPVLINLFLNRGTGSIAHIS